MPAAGPERTLVNDLGAFGHRAARELCTRFQRPLVRDLDDSLALGLEPLEQAALVLASLLLEQPKVTVIFGHCDGCIELPAVEHGGMPASEKSN